MSTLRGFVRKNKIKMETEWADENPNMNGMPQGSSHFKCTLKHKGRQFTTYFSMGPAHSKEPTVNDVLDCLASDSSSIENSPHFEDWASDLGYDTDSRSAEKAFNACVKQSEGLKRLLGESLYEDLLWSTERL